MHKGQAAPFGSFHSADFKTLRNFLRSLHNRRCGLLFGPKKGIIGVTQSEPSFFTAETEVHMARIEDIANKLNISKGTVSKALNGAPDVSETLRKTVLETAVELGYSRSMRKRGAKQVCLFIENMTCAEPSDFGHDIVVGFRKAAEPAGFVVQVVPLNEQIQKSITYDEYMLQNNYTGAFFLGLSLSDVWLHQLQTSRTPAVLLDNRARSNPAACYVGVDNNEGMDLAISHLKELGHRRIGYLSGGLGSYINQVRYSAFFHALRKNNLPDDHSLAGSDYYFSVCLQKHLPALLRQKVTAIICSHDLLAHTVMIHCQELGLRVPEDLSIVGFDDLPLCAYTVPPMTTIRQDRTQLGKSAFYALSSLLAEVPISTLLLHPRLMVRHSTGPAAEN